MLTKLIHKNISITDLFHLLILDVSRCKCQTVQLLTTPEYYHYRYPLIFVRFMIEAIQTTNMKEIIF